MQSDVTGGGFQYQPMISSDLPSTYTATFQGASTNTDLTQNFTKNSASASTIRMVNSFASETRATTLSLSSMAISGYQIYKVDVNVTGNQVVAQDDWVHINKLQTTTPYERTIDNATMRSYNEMLGQQITGTVRYQIKNISTYIVITTINGQSTSNPRLQLWNNASSMYGDVPGTNMWSSDLAKTTNGSRVWIHTACNYIINASTPSNRSWYVVINGTDWANGLPGVDYIYWSHSNTALTGGRIKPWDQTWYPITPTRRFALAYQRLLLNDNNAQNRTMTPLSAGLAMNGTAFDGNGRATLSGTDLKALNFTSSVTSLATSVNIKAYYRAIVSCDRKFFSDGTANIKWNITSPSQVTFPASTDNRGFRVSIPAGWTVTGLYNASTASGLATAPNFTTYTVAGGVLTATGIKADSFWQVRCASPNRVSSISYLVGGTLVTTANKTNTIKLRVNLSTAQSAGNMSLGVYNPAYIGTARAFGTSNASFGGSVTTVYFPSDWTAGSNIVGHYRVQARWNTTTDVGFVSTTFLVLGRMNIALTSVYQYGSALSQLNGRYQGVYGDNIIMTHAMSDLTNGSSIPGLVHAFTTNGSTDASGTTSNSSLAKTLPFATRAVSNYSVVVSFQRAYYHNYTATVNIEIDPCPTTVTIISIQRGSIPLYRNASSIYFTNNSAFTVTFEYKNQNNGLLITSLSNGDVYEGSSHFTGTSSTGTFAISVNPSNLTAGIVLSFQASASNANYVTSQAQFQMVKDTTTPITNLVYTPVYSPNYVNATTQFTLTRSDPGVRASDINSTYYRINSGTTTLYSTPFTLGVSNGSVLVEYYSIDQAGNIQLTNSTTIRLDTIAPTTSISYTAAYAPNFVNVTTAFTLSASDNAGGSGLRARWYRLNGGAWINYTGAFNVAAAGNGTVLIEYRSTDKVWNVETTQSLTVR
ncbi:MAG: hypothetical protein GYA24_01735, partial [Candidatus Lokiarchaeota archaeon]|nr:hypothetical protein [Candidatus Lokiarchaeota archaeon]